MFNTWFFLFLLAALADWYFVSICRDAPRLVSKPLVLLLLIAWFSTSGGWQRPGGVFFGVALVFSLLGDIFLLNNFTRTRPVFFQMGLGAFLVAQVGYIIGFNLTAGPLHLLLAAALVLVAVVGYLNARGVVRSLLGSPAQAGLAPPVVVYMVTISLMLASAWSTTFREGWQPAGALLAGIGASLFYISDSFIAHDKFVRPISCADLVLTVTYHLGQLGIVAGLLSGV